MTHLMSLPQVDSADPPFPRNSGYWWFGCRSATKGSQVDLSISNSGPSASDPEPNPSNQYYRWLVKADHQMNQNQDVSDLKLEAGKWCRVESGFVGDFR